VVIGDLSLRPEAKEYYDTFTSSPRAVFQKTDVTKWSDLEQMFNVANKEFGSFDILCAGAGLFDPK
jgi:NAD(P)-dependent dehydrogenase (short-subunit alcohol dehydrogenase family)